MRFLFVPEICSWNCLLVVLTFAFDMGLFLLDKFYKNCKGTVDIIISLQDAFKINFDCKARLL